MTKRCGVCHIDKTYEEFYKNTARSNGISSDCKECRRAIYKQNFKSKKSTDPIVERVCNICGFLKPASEFYRYAKNNNPVADCIDCRKLRTKGNHYKSKYGITKEEYSEIFHVQNGLCLICGNASERRLCVDHCHKTGFIRGLLCNHCNTAIGFLKEDPSLIRRAAEYIESAKERELDSILESM